MSTSQLNRRSWFRSLAGAGGLAAFGAIGEALAAHTIGAAFAEFQENDKGTLARGKLADMVILSDDLLAIPPARIKDVRVLTTIVGGRVVHQRNP